MNNGLDLLREPCSVIVTILCLFIYTSIILSPRSFVRLQNAHLHLAAHRGLLYFYTTPEMFNLEVQNVNLPCIITKQSIHCLPTMSLYKQHLVVYLHLYFGAFTVCCGRCPKKTSRYKQGKHRK